MLRRGRWGMAAAALLLAGVASAANVNFSGAAVSGCTLSGATYRCGTLPLGANDTAVINSGYTVIVNADVALAYAQGLSMSGSAVLQSTGNLDLSASNGLNVAGGTLAAAGNFKLGSSAQSITANVTAATLSTGGSSTYIGGSVTTSGDISLGSNTTITGAVTTTGNGDISTGSSTTLGPVTAKGKVSLSSSNTINGSVNAASISTNSSVTINGSITLDSSTSVGVADLGSGIKVTGDVNAYSVKTNSPGTINGAIVATTTIALGSSITVDGQIRGTTITTNSPVTLNGGVNASVAFTLGSGSSVTGNITSPVVTLNASNITVKGDITAITSLDMGSGTAITGKVGTGTLTMRASNAVINGNTTVTGDVDMGSGTTINGDLSARNVTTRASNAVINGNAAVNAIYIDWGNSVSKTITCTGPGASGCSCVTRADSSYKPTCGPPAASAPHHFQITHSGSGLTCQPSAVTVRACADAACSTVYTGNAQTTLTPNGGTVTVSGDTAASVSYPTPATVTLSAGAGTTCINSGGSNTSCDMVFASSGLQLSAPDHVSMSGAKLTVQALKSGPNNAYCVPLTQGPTKINFSCGYLDPASGNQSLTLGSTGVACNGGATPVDVTLDNTGLGTLALQYPDVGLMSVNANYTASSGTGANGSTSFTAAPAKFLIVATADPQTPVVTMADSAFARAGDTFRLKVTAQNATGGTTENFGLEKSAETISMSPLLLKLPSDGDNPQLGKAQGVFDAIVKGVANSKTDSTGQWLFNETGVVTINATLANSSGFYMRKTALTGFRTTGTLDLRFAPHHFDVVLLAGAPMDCANVGGYSNPCAADTSTGVRSFVYSKQPFGVQVKAYKDATNLSKNYRLKTVAADTDSIVRPITLSPAKAAGGAASSDFVAFTSGQFPFGFTGGLGTLSGTSPALTFIAAQAPPVPPNTTVTTSPPTTIYLRAVDTYNASSARAGAVEPPLTVVSGRMMLSNAFGPANTNLPVEAQARYYSSASGAWLLNPAFPGTPASGSVTLATDSATFSTCTGSVLCTSLQLLLSAPPAAATTLSFKSGKGMFTVAAPKATGKAKIKLNPGLFPYLPMYDEGNLTFGVSRSGPVIYTREVYN
jgi:MSHA biogenesis protein MshQ